MTTQDVARQVHFWYVNLHSDSDAFYCSICCKNLQFETKWEDTLAPLLLSSGGTSLVVATLSLCPTFSTTTT